ncbi:MAG: DegT/DnrJ/EryC1/StrS family aminotransferase [Gemmatimonadetes bacterium]|nr:DegT/DnrJ/EryC1/StrS family aminotransferase [Gemmatimonadota bacterium]
MPPRDETMVRFLDLRRQYESIQGDVDAAIRAVLADTAFVSGPHVRRFEEEFAAYQRVAHCVAMANGTDAIEIALEALDLPPGSEVIVPANSFIASSEAVTRSGLRVVFADCDPATYTLSPADVERRITPSTSAIMAVHLYGHPCDMDALLALAARHGLRVIEDCAQAHGAEYKGRRVGGIGDLATFSFYPGKNLGAYGDAGAVTTNDAALAKRCRMIANHGRVAKYDHEFEGRNSRMDGLQGAILSAKLPHLDGWLDTRIALADEYRRVLGDADLVLPAAEPWARHVYHLFVVRTPERDALQRWLGEQGVETGIHYPIALPKLKAYEYLGQAAEPMFANGADSQLLSLPIGEHLEPGDLAAVARAVEGFFAHAAA